jgi:hypothetical protein
MRTKRVVACLAAAVMAFGAFAAAATTAITAGHSTLKGHSLIRSASISPAGISGTDSNYHDI